MSTDYILETRDLTREFKGFVAVDKVNLKVRRGSIHALIGPNGAGKTTLFSTLVGLHRPDSGTIRLDGHDLVGLKPHKIAAAGMVKTFQNVALFLDSSVL
eukprot:gene19267-biopygen12339